MIASLGKFIFTALKLEYIKEKASAFMEALPELFEELLELLELLELAGVGRARPMKSKVSRDSAISMCISPI